MRLTFAICGVVFRRSSFVNRSYNAIKTYSTSPARLSNNPEMADSSPIGYTAPKEISIPTPWGHLAAKEWGSPYGKPVLGVHGWQDNAGTFDTLAPLLPSNWHFVCLDLAGHGLSSQLPPGMSYYITEFLIQIKRAVNYLNWTKFSYIGHSMGGGLGMVLAGTYPDMIENLVAIDIIKLFTDPLNKWKGNSVGYAIDQLLEFEKKDKASTVPSYTLTEARQRLLESTGTALTKDSANILLKRGTKPSTDGKVVFTRDRRLQLRSILRIPNEHYYKLVEQTSTNLLIIKAKDGPSYEPQEQLDSIIQLYRTSCPIFKFLELEGTHHIHLNNPERVAPHVIQFINKLSCL